MNYSQSLEILEEIKKANKILLNCHRGPDPDSIGSVLAMRQILKGMDKEVHIICPSVDLPKTVQDLAGYSEIESGTDFNSFDFSKYDLFIVLDSSNWDMVAGNKNFIPTSIKTVVIDHHFTNTKFGQLNIVDEKVTSTAELLYLIVEDWGVKINKDIADCLMFGIIGDTGAFRYPGANENTFRVTMELMKIGADKDKAIHALYRSEPYELIQFYGEVLSRVKLDKENKFVWSAIPYDIYKKLGEPSMAKESAASLFAQVVEGTDFGFVAVEQEKDKLSVSFRSRTGLDTSKMALELGGGGHIYASGARVDGEFDQALEKVLEVCKKYAKK